MEPQHQQDTNFSLKQLVRQRLIGLIQATMVKSSTKELILIMDNYTISLMSNLFNLSQLVGIGVGIVQKLEVKRKPLPMHALLVLSTFQRIQDEEEGLYLRIHVLFPYKCSKDILQQLSLSAKIMKKIRSIKEFYHTLFFINDNVVTMKQQYLQVAYSDLNSNRENKIRGRISDKFIQIFRNIKSFHQINLYYKKSISGVAERVAETISEDFKQFTSVLRREKSSNLSQEADNVEVLLIDRSIDPVTPFLHDLFYESMLFDLQGLQLVHFPTKQQKQREKNKQQVLPRGLNQIQDPAYNRYRYRHIADVLEQLPRDIVTLSKKVKQATTQNILDIDINISKKYELHMKLVRECQNSFNDKNLKQVGELQQSLATGIDINGAETSSVKLIDNIKQMMEFDCITEMDKLRLSLIAYCCISFSEKDYKKLTKLIAQEHHRAFVNMVWLGIGLSIETKRSTKNIKDNIRKIAQQKLNKHNMNLSRYTGIVELILPIIAEGLANNIKIDEDIFGSIVVNPNKRTAVETVITKQTRKRQKIVITQPKKKRILIILFVGGASYAQIRAINNLGIQDKFNLIIAADNYMTPEEYIQQIKNMKSPN